jgi:hypothetical protein
MEIKMKKSYLEIQKEVIENYKIVIVENSTCRCRTHAHCDGTRRVCKWKPLNSMASTFTLLHEVGHIMTYKSGMRRCEDEYYATIWALEKCKEYGLEVPEKIVISYQRYIDREKQRGLNRNGVGYGNYDLTNYDKSEIKELKIKEPKEVKPKRIRLL